MTNLEYYKDLLKKIGIGSFSLTYEGVGECWDTNCSECFFGNETGIGCHNDKVDWLLKEHEESEINLDNEVDWTKVPVDTPVLVREYDCGEWEPEHFVTILPSAIRFKYITFADGADREEAKGIVAWNYCKLVRPEDIKKYRKEDNAEH